MGVSKLEKYILNSKPRIGWEGTEDPNHFEISKLIYQNRPEFRYIYDDMLSQEREDAINELLRSEFENLFSETRYLLIKDCLNLRFKELRTILNHTKGGTPEKAYCDKWRSNKI
ncbi:MAG: hypothetical protein R2792_04245 [Saprospiraceae bacterium]